MIHSLKINRIIILCIFILSFINQATGAEIGDEKKKPKKEKEKEEESVLALNTGYFTLGAGYGLATFVGDIGSDKNIKFTNRFKTAYNFSIEKRFGKVLGVSGNVMVGKLSGNERSVERHFNFQSDYKQFGLNLTSHFDWDGNTFFAPYISAGVGYMMFNSYTDSLSNSGTPYYYWSNGSIRDLPEFDISGNKILENVVKSKDIPRDYTYETRLNKTWDPSKTTNYKKTSLVFPLTLGFKLKMTEFLETRLSGTYNVLQTDFIDNYIDGKNDSYISAAFSIHYTIGKKYVDPAEKIFDAEKLKELGREDKDGDGVNDFDDLCANTKRGMPVDKKGCPLDDDKDGVPNYKDKEANTKPGAIVDGEGKALTDAQIGYLDSVRKGIYVKRSSSFTAAPSDETLNAMGIEIEGDIKKRGGPTKALPGKFLFADINDDSIIQASEISNAIDMFFSGEIDVRVVVLMDLIDYFFEQY